MWHLQTVSKYLLVKYLLISKQTGTLSLLVQKIDFWGVHLGGSWGCGTPKLCQNICLLNICWYQSKLAPKLESFKKLIFGGPFGGVPGEWHPQTMSKYLSVKYLLISKTTSTLAWAVQKIDFLGPHFGGVPVELPQKISGEKMRLQLNNFTQKLYFDVLWFRRRIAYKN